MAIGARGVSGAKPLEETSKFQVNNRPLQTHSHPEGKTPQGGEVSRLREVPPVSTERLTISAEKIRR